MTSVQQVMEQGIEDQVFPGAVLMVSQKGHSVFSEAFGLAGTAPERPMTPETVFDLASLTKPLATVVSYIVLMQDELLHPDRTLGSVLPAFESTDKKDITIRQLLSHSSGLPAYQPYFEKLKDIPLQNRLNALQDYLVQEPLIHKPGQVCVYSDLGFMVLQWILEDTTKTPLDAFVKQKVYAPLGLRDLFFNRLERTRKDTVYTYAATEHCPWRNRVMEGRVHDDHAYLLGGVAGHAGLFGNVASVNHVLQSLLNTWKGNAGEGIFATSWVRTFFKRQSDAGSWALGFDTPTRPDSSSGRYFSDASVGHLGFTGTSFWMDLEKEIIVVLLTNRVHPTRENEKIKQFRPLLHDTVMTALAEKSP